MKKFFKWTGITILVILVLLLIAPFLFKGQIMDAVKSAANDNLNAVVGFDDVSLSLIKNFPNLRVSIENFSVQNVAPFDSVMLAKIGSLEAVVDVMSLFGDEISVKKIGIVNPVFDVRVMADGKANYDVAKADSTVTEATADTSASGGFKLKLKEYYIENGIISYDDKSLPYSLKLEGLNHRGTGNFTDEIFVLETKTTIDKTTTAYDGTTYVKNAKSDIVANLEIENKETMKITFKDNVIKLNELEIAANGWFAMPPDGSYDMDITYAATKTDFRNLLSMVPAAFASDLSGVDVTGKMAFDGFVRGKFSDTSMPGFGVNMMVENGRFKYPDLPKSVDNIQVKATIDASDGNDYDKMKIDVEKFHIEMAQNPVDMTLKLRTPMSDPDIDFTCVAKIVLDNVKEFIPLEQGDDVHGTIDADVALKGRMSSVEQERYEEFFAEGKMIITNVMFQSDSLPYDMNVNSATFAFTPAYLDLSNFSAQIGKSDLAASGKIENYLAYALKDSLLSGRFNVSSRLMDLNEFMTEEETTTTETAVAETSADLAPIELPGNVDFNLDADFTKVIYGTNEITNLKGGIGLKEKIASLNNVTMNVIDGVVGMNGSYNAQNLEKPKVDFDYDIQHMDINKAATQFNTIEKMAPIAKSCNGQFSSKFTLTSILDSKMQPINSSVNGKGTLATDNVTIKEFKPLVKIAEVTKIDKLKNQTIQNVNTSFKITDGVVYVDPFTVMLDGMPAKIYGSTTLEQQIDYNMEIDIPFEKFPQGAVNEANSLLAMANKKLGTNISAGNKLPVKLKITGTVQDPKIATNYGELGKDAVNNLTDELIAKGKEEAKEQLTNLKNEALEKAIAEKARLIAEAQSAADKLVAEAQKNADKAKAEAQSAAQKGKDELYKQAKKLEDDAAGNPLKKVAAKVAADKLRKEADDKYTKALDEANKAAQKPVESAKVQGDKLVKEAEAKGDKMIADANATGDQNINKIK